MLRKEETVNFIELYDMAADKLAPDNFSAYVIALQGVRREPANPFAHQRLALGLHGMAGRTIDGPPMLPDAADRAAAEVQFTYYAAFRRLDHPEDWRDANTKGALEHVIAWAKARMAPSAGR